MNTMAGYLLKRIVAAVPTIIGITVLVFVMVRLVPGDPVDIMFNNLAPPSAQQRTALRAELGLDLPLYQQYFRYVSRALTGDLGRSFRTKRPVREEISTRFPNTLRLTALSLVLATVTGVILGVMAATRRGSWLDSTSMVAAIGGVSIPSFWLGLMLIMLFSVRLRWLPVAGASTWKHLVLPAVTLAVSASAVLARMTRSAMLDVLTKQFIVTARAKGLPRRSVEFKHALKNALIPVVTIMGLQVGGLLSGAFIIEAVFGFPGIGQLAVNALNTRDFPLIQGIVLLVAMIFVLVNMVVDVVYAFVDPRISYR
jgi:peptide/nickel transport system permease protein